MPEQANTFPRPDTGNPPDLSIVLPTKDRQALLFKTLAALIDAVHGISCEILVIDNSEGPEISLPEHLRREFISIQKNPGNRNSVFASRNFGSRIARSSALLFLDDDILVNESAIRFVVDFQRKHPEAAANVSWTYPPELLGGMQQKFFGRFLIRRGFTTMRELYGKEKWQEGELFRSVDVASFFLSIPKKLFVQIGGYEERHLHEGTDIDLIGKMKTHGIPMYIHAGIVVYHNEEDRVGMKGWLERKKRLGEISAHAVRMGNKPGHEMHYSASRKMLFKLIWMMRPLFFFFIHIVPGRMKFLDTFMFGLLSALTGAYIHKGYSTPAPAGTSGKPNS